MNKYKITLLHMYPDLLNLYGDKGNIQCMKKRLEWRGIEAEVLRCTSASSAPDFENADIIFIGGGSDREQEIVCSKLLAYQSEISAFVENGGSLLAVCGGYQLLGKYYKTKDKEIKGLKLLDIYTEAPQNTNRLIGNVVLNSDLTNHPIVGFENHGGRTKIGNHTPLGKVEFGFGNDGESGFEGVVYKNLIGTYLHGPLLPKNPELCDRILENALKHKYPNFEKLSPLCDTLENEANDYISNTYKK